MRARFSSDRSKGRIPRSAASRSSISCRPGSVAVIATADPGRDRAPRSGSGKLCRGWKAPTATPSAAKGCSAATGTAPLRWIAPWRPVTRLARVAATSAMAPSLTATTSRSAGGSGPSTPTKSASSRLAELVTSPRPTTAVARCPAALSASPSDIPARPGPTRITTMVPDANAGNRPADWPGAPAYALPGCVLRCRRTGRHLPCWLLGCSGRRTVTTTLADQPPRPPSTATTAPATTSPRDHADIDCNFLHHGFLHRGPIRRPGAAGSRGEARTPHGVVHPPRRPAL